MAYVQREEDELEAKRLHCMYRALSAALNIALTQTLQIFELLMPSRVRFNSSETEDGLVITFLLAVGIMLKEPNWAQSFIPNHKSLSKVRRSISRQATPSNHMGPARPEKRLKRDSRVTPLIKAEEWAVRVVGDVDMNRFSCREPHIARCVIL